MFRGKKQKRIISVILTVTLLSAAAATVTGVGALTVKSLNDAVTREHQANEADRNMAPVSYTHLDVYKRQGQIAPNESKR